MSTLPIAATGLTSAFAQFDKASQQLVQSTQSFATDAPTQAVVDLTDAKTRLQAAIAVQRTEDDMTKTLLDITV